MVGREEGELRTLGCVRVTEEVMEVFRMMVNGDEGGVKANNAWRGAGWQGRW